mmetsp:Transcript_18068/g.47572  ORF Transcript_18068/g.47572 Transcript_18068/m.47572 type:complete len:208 (-) Transcript_18068:49-672(-)
MRSYRASASASASRSLARSSHAASASSDASTMSASWASAAASAAMSASVSPFFIIRRPSTSFALPSARRRSRSASAYSADASHARWHAAFFSRTAVTSAQCSRWMSRQRHAALYAESFAIFDASVALSHPCKDRASTHGSGVVLRSKSSATASRPRRTCGAGLTAPGTVTGLIAVPTCAAIVRARALVHPTDARGMQARRPRAANSS